MAKKKKKTITKAKPKARLASRATKAPARKKRAGVAKKPAARAPRAAGRPSAKDEYLQSLGREHATTLKVMRAYPDHQHEFQPHTRSSTAKQLMWTFVIENELLHGALAGTLKMPPEFPAPPQTIPEVIAAYEAIVGKVKALIERMPEDRMADTFTFFTGPRQVGDVRIGDFMWMMLMDSIHHRGQLSVYLRMAGGLVPSIYGPSADEPWN